MDKNEKLEMLSTMKAASEINDISKAISVNLYNVVRLKDELVSRCRAFGLECEIEYETGHVLMFVLEATVNENFYIESHMVAKAMLNHGGGFVREIGSMLEHADYQNSKKIKKAWPEYWNEYVEIAKHDVPLESEVE